MQFPYFSVTKVALLQLVLSEKKKKQPVTVKTSAGSSSAGKEEEGEEESSRITGLCLTLPCSPGPESLIANTKSSLAQAKHTEGPEVSSDSTLTQRAQVQNAHTLTSQRAFR